MTKEFAVLIILAVIGATFLTCADAPLVVQGSVVQYDSDGKTLVIKDDQNPYQEVTLDLSSADMGMEPKIGEIVRISFNDTPQGKVAIRVMNLSHQIK